MNWDSWEDWFKIICVLIILIVLLVGFLAGYFYGDKSCIEDPLTYGIKKINEINNDEFTCSCNSIFGKTKPFSFDENGFKNNFLE